MSEVRVRRVRKKDAVAIRRIDASITKGQSTLDFERIVAEEVGKSTDASFVAEVNGKVVGYMISYLTRGNFGVDNCAWIAMFGVDPKFMGQGIGKRLADEIFKFCKEKGVTNVFTSVSWDSTDILSFFKTLGFNRSDFINLRKSLE
ncbi:MAG: GNAT family N-acetyltransferase [Desulfobacteraceae bacterium]